MMAASRVISAEPSSRSFKNTVSRTLGKSGIKVPVISFGVMRADNPGLCKASFDSGIILFDAASGFNIGNNESMLGNVFEGVNRDSFIIGTKIRPAGLTGDGKPTYQTTCEDFLKQFDSCLSRLRLDYVDILLVQDIRNLELLEYKPLIAAVEKLKKERKTRLIGFSTHNNAAEMISAAADTERWDVIMTSYNFKLNNIKEIDAALRKANRSGIGIMAMQTLAEGGFLDKEKTRPVNSSAAIKWALSNQDIHTAVTGMTTLAHLETNLKILENIDLTEEERTDLLIAAEDIGLFCSGCNNCIHNCPMKLPIPDLMRAYMYAYGYSDLPAAYSLLGELGTGPSPCINCSSCSVSCPSRFRIREKISDISRLVNVPSDFVV